MPSVPLTGLSAQDPVPGQVAEINFAQGPAAGSGNVRPILIIANKSAAGSATPDTVVYGPTSSPQLVSNQDCINLFGQGSEVHRMWKRITAVNTVTPVYVVAPTESIGAAATGVITITGSATASGSARIWVGDDFVDAPISNGDAVTAIALAIQNAVNSRPDWAVTALAAIGVCTLTAKNKGLRGNWIRFQAVINGTNVGTASSASTIGFFTGGTTADSNVAALATIINSRYYEIASAAEDAAQMGAALSQVNTQALPINGLRQRVFAASVDTQANSNTIATGLNGARAELTWLQNSDVTPSELAANAAAVYALEEAKSVPRLNFSGYGNDAVTATNWKIKAPRSGTIPTRTQIFTALQNGVTPIGVNLNGTTYLVKRITTRSLNGASPDYRIRDAHKVTVCDFFTDDLLAKFTAQFSGKLIADDPVPGARVPGPNVVTPRVVKAAMVKLILDYLSNDLLQNGDTIIANTYANRETAPTTRMSGRIPLQPIDLFDQGAWAIDQVAGLAIGVGLSALSILHFFA